jgi:hypothetical protein
MQLLIELGELNDSEYSELRHWHKTGLMNNLKEHIGHIIPVFYKNQEIKLGQELS